MLCCVHLTVISLSILKVLRVPLSFRCLIFKVLRTFWKVFCRFLPNLSQQCVNYYITLIFVCQHFFQTFLKSFFEISFKTFYKLYSVLSNFSVVFVLSSSDFVIISPLFTNCNPFFQFFSNFLKKFLLHLYKYNIWCLHNAYILLLVCENTA